MRRALIRIAAELPQGDPTRRRLLAVLSGVSRRHARRKTADSFISQPSAAFDIVQKHFESGAFDTWGKVLREGFEKLIPGSKVAVELRLKGNPAKSGFWGDKNAPEDGGFYVISGQWFARLNVKGEIPRVMDSKFQFATDWFPVGPKDMDMDTYWTDVPRAVFDKHAPWPFEAYKDVT